MSKRTMTYQTMREKVLAHHPLAKCEKRRHAGFVVTLPGDEPGTREDAGEGYNAQSAWRATHQEEEADA